MDKTIVNSKLFYYTGDVHLLDQPIVAVIGKRDVDVSVLNIAFETGQSLALEGISVLNGLAVGCDKAAAEGAISVGGKVIAILPGGLNNIYPQTCLSLANAIVSNGGLLLSQYSPDAAPNKISFIERDKVQAELSHKIISVYCDKNGGTMHTLKFAKANKKPIGCMLQSDGNEYAINHFNAARLIDIEDTIRFAKEPEYTQFSLFADMQGVLV